MHPRFYYFKTVFFPLLAGLLIGQLVYRFMSRDLQDETVTVGKIMLQSLLTALAVASLLGILNMFVRFDLKQPKP